MRVRLRPAMPAAEAAEAYRERHQHLMWGAGHSLRVAVSAEHAAWAAEVHRATSIADLSAGDGHIVGRAVEARAAAGAPFTRVVLGDLAPGLDVCGPIESTLAGLEPVDVFVCCETLEHLDDPDTVVAGIRGVAGVLVASVPLAPGLVDNEEQHYWAFDMVGGEQMFTAAGWTVEARTAVEPVGHTYAYGIWVLS